MNERCLVTGAGGAVGVHMVAHLMHNTDWDVVAVDSFRHKGRLDRLGVLLKSHPEWRPRLDVITHDLCAPFTPDQTASVSPVDYLIHLASLSDVADSIADPVPFVRNNVELQLNVLDIAVWVQGLKAFVQFSTDEVYGPAAVDQGHREWDPILPSNPYAASKAAQEALAIAWWRSYGLPLVITNTMNNFGEMQGPSKYPVKIQQAVEAGDTVTVHAAADGTVGTRHYLHSRNAADAVLWILRNTEPTMHRPGHVDRPDRWNIVGNRQMSNLELAQTIADLMERPLHAELVDFHSKRPGHDLHYGLDGSKLADAGWRAPVSFEESMAETIRWQRTHPEWLR